MQEIELKLCIPPSALNAVERTVMGGTADTPSRVRLLAIYFDTADRRLAAAGMALRVRKEGRRWVQTLKASGPNAMQRLEHNVPLVATRGTVPTADPARHQGSPAGDLITAALAPRDGESEPAQLLELFRTDIQRRTRTLRTAKGTLELALDQGRIFAADRKLPVCELEIELLRGQPLAVIEQARRWVKQHGLWLDTQTKAQRGDLLSRGAAAKPVKASVPTWPPQISAAEASQKMHGWLFDVLLANASILAKPADTQAPDLADRAETLRLLRVALRRLRAGWRLLPAGEAPDAIAPKPAVMEALRALFTQLGQLRDHDVLAGLLPQLRAAGAPPIALASTPNDLSLNDLAGVVQATATNLLWLDLLEVAVRTVPTEPVPGIPVGASLATPPQPWPPQAMAKLRSWHRRLLRDAEHLDDMDDTALHELRKRLKRLRYGIEMMQGLLPRRACKRFLRQVAKVQDALGAYNDLVMARAALQPSAAAGDTGAAFALGWIAVQLPNYKALCVSAVSTLRDTPKWWASK